MRRRAAVVVAACVLVGTAAGCDQQVGGASPDPRNTSERPAPTDVSEHESGPDSPIAYGFQVPRGATQVGPLVRYRSNRLIAAYKPELDAAQAQRDAEQQRRRTEAEANGTPLPPPTPTPTTQPSDDTFRLLESPPKPDITISLMRVDGSPTEVVRRMAAQIDVILPNAGIIRSDISSYCDDRDRRITGCRIEAEGTAANDRDLKVTLTVDPGDLKSRAAPPATNQNPVMQLKIEYVGDPRRGQVDRRGDGDIDVPREVTQADTSGLIWPKMDEDAPLTTPLLNDWSAPLGSPVLLSGFEPDFVAMATAKALDSDRIASLFAETVSEEPAKDIVEDLNEITTTYIAERKNGEVAMASFVLSARGYYAMLFYTPPDDGKN
ncbi:MAG: hypothetical protein ACR2FE_07490 [Aeromicrobium sp.]